ncbi:binding-protein-dependent transport systems inner membrane component [Solidesulfovibrio fructosivorans JJ]]|uniref:Binding-protein-dependent transport systems inner membrane component n=1 Tax=Solidesulfovibrio fructosivorans JJ] TaxID=596151 RepID=E1JV80_SOLFR|nr:ABC transporter permease [Solidesulfovibrio fructosivorans]EFL51674.1 binding-protein-dependent transport systems inner membrane component [Solidesulfovibrio fructosivorans JJ]]
MRRVSGLIVFVALACLWEAVSRLGIVSHLYFPPVSIIAVTFWKLTVSGLLPLQAGQTLTRALAGLGIAAAVAVPLGLGMGVSRRLARLLSPTVELLRPVPPPAIIPAAMLLFGIGSGMKVFVVFFACFFPILVGAMDGARAVPPQFRLTAAAYGLSRFDTLARVMLPAAGPSVAAGFRTAVPMALIVAVLSEMIGATSGIGHYILRMQRTFAIPEMYAGVAMLGILGLGLNAAVERVTARLLRWHDGRGDAMEG